MDFCDKCGEEIETMEPCIRLEYGFVNPEKTFDSLGFLHLHVDCVNDLEALNKVIESLEKN
mgnify:CR=1 FL=1